MKMIKKAVATLLMLPTLSYAAPSATATAITQGIRTQIMKPTTITSTHVVTIANDTPGMKIYYWTISLCPMTQKNKCIKQSDHLGLAQGQHWTHTYTLQNVIIFQAVGAKPVAAKTEITGAANSVANDTKYVDVVY